MLSLVTHVCRKSRVYLTKSPNGHILAEQVLPDILKPALNYFFPTYGFARNIEELDGTNFFGLNPNILKQDLKEKAFQTKATTQVIEQAVQPVENPSKLLKSEKIFTEDTDSTKKNVSSNAN